MEILNFNEIDQSRKASYLEGIKDIFFSCSSVKSFKDIDHQNSFFKKWCGDYLALCPDQFYVAQVNNEVLGYLSGHLNSNLALEQLSVPGAGQFAKYYDSYPAHFHINCSPCHQGKGIGRKLIENYIMMLHEYEVSGVHLITSTDADNLGFYRALGFDTEIVKSFGQTNLLLMGREFTS